MGKPSLSHVVWVKTHPNLTSRVWDGWPSVLPCRPTVSFFTTGISVPSICTYRIETASPIISADPTHRHVGSPPPRLRRHAPRYPPLPVPPFCWFPPNCH